MAFLRHLDTRDIYDIWDICKMSTTCFCDIIYWDDIYREMRDAFIYEIYKFLFYFLTGEL